MTLDFTQQQTLTICIDGLEEIDIEVECVYSIGKAEPDVGIFTDFVDDMYLNHDDGKRAHDVEDKLSKEEWGDLYVRVMEDHIPNHEEYER